MPVEGSDIDAVAIAGGGTTKSVGKRTGLGGATALTGVAETKTWGDGVKVTVFGCGNTAPIAIGAGKTDDPIRELAGKL